MYNRIQKQANDAFFKSVSWEEHTNITKNMIKVFRDILMLEKKVVVLELCVADNLIGNGVQFQLFHRYNLVIQQGF